MEKIRVLRIINRFNIGGPTYNATLLSRFLNEDKYETLLVGGLPEEGETDSLYIPKQYGLDPVLIPEMQREPNFRSDRAAYIRLKEIIREFNPHIVHTHAAKAGALGRRAAYSAGVPIIIHTFHGHVFHSYFGKVKTMLFKQIERRLANRSSRIVAISEIQKDELTKLHRICASEKMEVVPLGFDLDPFHHARESKRQEVRDNFNLSDEVAIALIGRFAPVKNHALLFDALELILPKLTRRIKVYIVGDGAERPYIETRSEEINVKYPETVTMTSWIKDIATFNSGMDIICLTSLNEGTPVSLIEAQASGVPVISTDVGGVRDVILENETGFIVPKNDTQTYAEKLLELIENEKKRESMSQNGWNHVRDKFSYQRLIADTERLYDRLLKEKGIQ
ncbi:MAG: glycosyltransferase family 1 protein [Bacteroidetes bacterium]|nr:MAG: glycosyltransferase family 1 protein [Bacteroidota bacterium]TNE98788.1 MAG: glycosyltransferase family 1 protein [Bacteroidota bacterium]